MERPRVGIVIPALNESGTIKAVVSAASSFGTCIVVNDGSTDRTAELAAAAGAVVVSHATNLGYDGALNSGFVKAAALGCEIVISLDADGQHDPTLIKQFINALDAGADVVIGVRSRRQRMAEHLFAAYTKLRYRIDDPLCGLKAYKTSVFRSLGHFDSFGSIGTELAIFAAKTGRRISQVPVQVRDRTDASRFGRVFSGNIRILRALALTAWH